MTMHNMEAGSSDVDAWIEEEIQRQLDALSPHMLDLGEDKPNVDEESIESIDNEEEEMPETFRSFINHVQHQTVHAEQQLEECDTIIQDADKKLTNVDSRKVYDLLQELAKEQGDDDPLTFRERMLNEIDEDDKKGFEIDVTPTSEALKIESDTEVSDTPRLEDDNDADGESTSAIELKALEQLKELEEKHKERELRRKQEEETRMQALKIKEEEIMKRRQEKIELLKIQEREMAEERQKKEEELKVQQQEEISKNELIQKQFDAQQKKEEDARVKEQEQLAREKTELEKTTLRKKNYSASRIQAFFKGNKDRKMYGEIIKQKKAERRREQELKRVKEIEQERAEHERRTKLMAEEKERQELEDQRLKALEEKRKQQELEEMEKKDEERKKEESERLRKEEEIRKHKEEELKKKEEKERLEQERKREEEQIKKEEEEKRKIEEEKQSRIKEEEENRRKLEEEERLRKEEELKRQQEEEQRREEEQRKQQELEKQLLEEERARKEEEARLLAESLSPKLEKCRIAWMESCKPWSKIQSLSKTRKLRSSRKPRRPSSSKVQVTIPHESILKAAKVSALAQVTTVELHDLPGSSLSSLGQCLKLKHLVVNNSNLVAVEGLENCQQLQYLDLKQNSVEYLDLNNLKYLWYVDLSNNSLASIHGLEETSGIRYLNLAHNKISRLGGLGGLKQLHTLNVSFNQLINTRGLSEVPTMQHLDVSHNHLAAIDELEDLCLLQTLRAQGNSIQQVPNLKNQVLLQELLLQENNVSTIQAVSESWLPLLSTLNLNQNNLSTLGDLSHCIMLKTVDLGSNMIMNTDDFLPQLAECNNLQDLTIDDIMDQMTTWSKLPSLVHLNGLEKPAEIKTENNKRLRSNFEKVCHIQIEGHRNLVQTYENSIKSLSGRPNTLPTKAQHQQSFYTQSHTLAEEDRYMHEYGDTTRQSQDTNKNFDNVLDSNNQEKEPIEQENHSVGSKSSEELAAVRIQSHWRGYVVRRDIDDHTKLWLAATIIQSAWRGYYTRLAVRALREQSIIMSYNVDIKTLESSAVKIQALWRGYCLRKKLQQAYMYAKLDDDEDLNMDLDMNMFNFNEAELDQEWLPPETPQLLHKPPVLRKISPSGERGHTPNGHHVPRPPLPRPPSAPRRAWRNADSPISVSTGEEIDQVQMENTPKYSSNNILGNAGSRLPEGYDPQQKPPRPPSSVLSGADTHRSHLSRKEEKMSEEWGFKDGRTAELMYKRAKKLQYNSQRKKKLGQLDPKQRLALVRKLEETTHQVVTARPPARKIPSRLNYFAAKEEEERKRKILKSEKDLDKNNRVFEWVHTQVGSHDVSDSKINQGMKKRFSSESNLPKMDAELVAGGRVSLVASPLALESVDDNNSTRSRSRSRRHSDDLSPRGRLDLPPIKTNSAPSMKIKERNTMYSWRMPVKNNDVGWGGGQKRSNSKR